MPSENPYKRPLRLILMLVALSLISAACGGGAEEGAGEEGPDTADTTEAATDTEAADTTETSETTADAAETEEESTGDPGFDLAGTTLRIGSSEPEALGMGIHYAVDLLEGWGAEVEHEFLTSVTGIEAIVADRLDVSASSADEVLVGVSQGAEVTAIGAPTSSMHYAVVTKPDITEVADLEGRTLAISSPGSFNALMFRLMLEQEGMDPEESVTYAQIGGTGERAAALLAGQVDAAVVYIDSWIELRQQTDDLALLGYIADMIPGLPSRLYYGADAYFADNPDMALAIACANLEANSWIQDDEQTFVDYTTNEMQAASPEAVAEFHGVALDLNMYPTDPEAVVNMEAVQGLTDIMTETGELENEVDLDALVDMSYLEEAVGMGCGS